MTRGDTTNQFLSARVRVIMLPWTLTIADPVMIKSQMALQIASQSPHLHQKQVEKALDAVLGEIVAAMRRRDRVELRGFGSFIVKFRQAHIQRLPTIIEKTSIRSGQAAIGGKSGQNTVRKTSKTGSKQSCVIALLSSPKGATIAAIMHATRWQQHSVRGFLAGVIRNRLKLNLISQKVDGNRVYRIIDGDIGGGAGEARRRVA